MNWKQMGIIVVVVLLAIWGLKQVNARWEIPVAGSIIESV